MKSWSLSLLVLTLILGSFLAYNRGLFSEWLGRPGAATPPAVAVAVTSKASAASVQAPDFTLKDLEGNVVSLSDFRGQAVLINFWATWCPPCRFEMPAIEEVYRKYRTQGFQVLAVDIQEPPDAVQRFVEQLGLTFTVLLDEDGSVAQQYWVRGIPTSFFVNRQGAIIAARVGAMSRDLIEQYATQALTDTAAPQQAASIPTDTHKVHWHTQLQVIVYGQNRALNNLENGQWIDLHSPNVSLGDALKSLGIAYGADCVLELCREDDRRGRLVVRINGQTRNDFEAYVLQDGDRVVMELQ